MELDPAAGSPRTRWIPNALTGLRFTLVPVASAFIWADDLRASFWVFLVAGITDALDGWLARLLNARTDLGAILDPLADKALLTATFFFLGLAGYIPAWLVALVIGRDAGILAGVAILRLMARCPVSLMPNMLGKGSTLSQIMLCALIIGGRVFAIDVEGPVVIMTAVVAVTAVASGLGYLVRWPRLSREARALGRAGIAKEGDAP